MDFPLKILRKHLANERKWLHVTVHDKQSHEGQRMAKERVPQLEKAIEKLTKTEYDQGNNRAATKRGEALPLLTDQLNLFV